MTQITPMLRQYQQMKSENPDALLFFRLGDFYEMFFDDARTASRELDITLTSRGGGDNERVPMCGVPHHAAENYIARLIEKGYRVAICEQIEDPKLAKGLVKRDIVRIISPGTLLEDNFLPDNRNNYLATLFCFNGDYGLCYSDISTGECRATEMITGEDRKNPVFDEIFRIGAREILLPRSLMDDVGFQFRIKKVFQGLMTPLPDEEFTEEAAIFALETHFQIENADALFLPPLGKIAAGATIAFLHKSQKRNLSYINSIKVYRTESYMVLDQATRRNLEISQTIFTNQKKGSLLWVMDKTATPMGKRLLKEWLENPLLELVKILERQDAVDDLYQKPLVINELKEFLGKIHDLERISGRIAYGNAGPRDIVALKDSIGHLPQFKSVLYQLESGVYRDMAEHFDDLYDIFNRISDTLNDDPPISPKEGGLVKPGFNREIDELRDISSGGKNSILAIEAREKEATGIKSLKVGYNKVFGYYIEVSNANKNLVPGHYVRKQTLANGERYFTEELKNHEDKVLGATERLYQKEYEIFCQIRDFIAVNAARIQMMAAYIAIADVLFSFAKTALENHYVRPLLNDGDALEIRGGRHPMVERMGEESFIANDALLDSGDNRIMVITGPNMAGKSTYMRQTALIILMAQIGSFVPADSAELGIIDRIFTRIGASDDLVGGNSTFMVEMTETADILRFATAKSFIILDEIGRGTSTFDGLAIAWAVIAHLTAGDMGPKTLFATHYHELTCLEQEMSHIKNYAISVREYNGDLVFLRKIAPGKANKSYGIQVAKLAGLPIGMINQARKILKSLEKNQLHFDNQKNKIEEIPGLFKEISEEQEEILAEIGSLDIDQLAPIKALGLLAEWQDRLKKEPHDN